jgi:hypothetical protein
MKERVVDFIIAGAQKCGTTTLAQILDTHPTISKYKGGEPHFFSTCDDWKEELDKYHEKFEWGSAGLHFEKSTSYTFYPHRNLEIWGDIYEYNKDMRIVYVMRDPVERVRSAYAHIFERGYYDGSIVEALTEMPLLISATRYASQIRPFIHQFGRDQVLLLFLQDLQARPMEINRKLAEFLGVDHEGFEKNASDIRANRSETEDGRPHQKYDNPGFFLRGIRRFIPSLYKRITDNSDRALDEKPSLPQKYERVIRYMLRSEIDEIEALTGRNLDHWRYGSSG